MQAWLTEVLRASRPGERKGTAMRQVWQRQANKSRWGVPLRRLVPGAAVVTALCSVTLVSSAGATGVAAGSSYVALGDSYASGPTSPPRSTPAACGQTPTTPVIRLGPFAHVDRRELQRRHHQNVISSQLGSLSSATAVVSVQVGGDDLGFVSILENCAALTPGGPPRSVPIARTITTPAGTTRWEP